MDIEHKPAEFRGALSAAGWWPPNRQALLAWLGSVHLPQDVAALDWDNTCIFGDVGDTVFAAQLERLELRHAPQALEATLALALKPAQARPDAPFLAALAADVHEAYRTIWRVGPGRARAGVPLEAASDLRSKLGTLYETLAHAPAATPACTAAAYALLGALWSQHTAAEVRAFAEAALLDAVAAPLGPRACTSATPGRSGVRTWRWAGGVRPLAPMQDLVRALAAAGVVPYVISASYEPLVRAAAAALHYDVAPEHIFGMRPADPEEPHTYGAGKVACLQRHVPGRVVFAAGDARTDLEMLTLPPHLQLRLVLHRPSQARALAPLFDAAMAPGDGAGCRTLLQGRDEAAGTLWPHQRSGAPGTAAPL